MARVVDENINSHSVAVELVEDFLRGVFFLQIFGDYVSRHAMLRFNVIGHPLQLGAHRCYKNERMPMSREFMREVKANAAGRTSDECSFVVHVFLPFSECAPASIAADDSPCLSKRAQHQFSFAEPSISIQYRGSAPRRVF